MELEFDKEIDAILRKGRSGAGVTKTGAAHLDADAIAAFAENTLPDKAKVNFIAHFADCDRCRKQLVQVMRLNAEADADAAAGFAVSEPETAASIPWFQKLFKAPSLALAMGALVLAFGGVLGFLVLQQRDARQSATVSQVREPEQPRGDADFDNGAASNTAPLNVLVATANPTAPAQNAAANPAAGAPMSGASGRVDADQAKPAAGAENNYLLDGADVAAEPPAKSAAAPPPPVTTDSTASTQGSESDEKKQNGGRKLKEEGKDRELAKIQTEDRGYRDAPRAAAKSGPSRAGPPQNQSNQINNKNFDMPVTRVVGGKPFNNRGGAWYDSAYRNQATVNYRRGTDEYKKLDSGLRNIAETLGGTVVIVWKSKAYRIQ